MELSLTHSALLSFILMLSAIVSGICGFGIPLIGAASLWILPPNLAVPLLMTLSAANQLLQLCIMKSLNPLKAGWRASPMPYLLGGLAGAPIGLWLLRWLPVPKLMVTFGVLLMAYSIYSLRKPLALQIQSRCGWLTKIMVGMTGGLIGGFTASPGSVLVVWTRIIGLSKNNTRTVLQTYILGMQIILLSVLAATHAETFNTAFWELLMTNLPPVLAGTVFGIWLYKRVTDVNFKRIALILLMISGVGMLVKGLLSWGILYPLYFNLWQFFVSDLAFFIRRSLYELNDAL